MCMSVHSSAQTETLLNWFPWIMNFPPHPEFNFDFSTQSFPVLSLFTGTVTVRLPSEEGGGD